MNGIGSIYDLTREQLVDKYKERIQALPKEVKRCWNGYVNIALFMAEWENMQSMFYNNHDTDSIFLRGVNYVEETSISGTIHKEQCIICKSAIDILRT